jgi:hypothetical protein
MTAGIKANADGSAAIQVGGSDAITITSGLAVTFPSNVSVTGNVSLTGATSTLGYGTGSGSTVTQLTNKLTAVTLNKPTGQITMSNAALAASAAAVFTVNNSLLSLSDTVILCGINNGLVAPDNYRIEVAAVTTGSFNARVTNITAGSRSEAIVLNFAVIKGATL